MTKPNDVIGNSDSSHCYRADSDNPYRSTIEQPADQHPRETSVFEWILTVAFCLFFVVGVLSTLERFGVLEFDSGGDPVFPGESGWSSE